GLTVPVRRVLNVRIVLCDRAAPSAPLAPFAPLAPAPVGPLAPSASLSTYARLASATYSANETPNPTNHAKLDTGPIAGISHPPPATAQPAAVATTAGRCQPPVYRYAPSVR